MYLVIVKKRKKAVLLLIPDDISIEEKMNVKVKFCNEAKLIKTKDTLYKNNTKIYVFTKN